MVYDGICTRDRLCIEVYLPVIRMFSVFPVSSSAHVDDSPEKWHAKEVKKKQHWLENEIALSIIYQTIQSMLETVDRC